MYRILVGLIATLTMPCFFVPLSAQDVSATIMGEIKDATGAVVPGARVTVTNLDTNILKSAVSASTCHNLSPLPLPCRYSLTVTSTCFKTYIETGIVHEVNQNATRDVRLQVGEISDRVEVSSELPLTATEDVAIGKVI